ncbi:MAG: type IV toxin-antitoxin system AbiEi family antitoxin domain-containing protein [Pseudomonadota bacterium]
MKTIKKINKLKKLMKKPSFKSSEVRKAGVNTALISYYIKTGLIERIDRGVYKNPNYSSDNFAFEDLFQSALGIKNGVICLISALSYWELTDEMPRVHWIAIPNKAKAPVRKNVKIIRMRNFNLGISKIKEKNYTIKIYNQERTIIDSFRLLDKEVAIKALKAYFNHNKLKPDIKTLTRYAKALRVDISKYLIMITTN